MKRILLSMFFLYFCFLQGNPVPWHRPDAGYRLVFERQVPGKAIYADLRSLVLPVSLENGMDLTDPAGKSAAFHKLRNGEIVILPDVPGKIFYLYFGFSRKHEIRHSAPAKDSLPPDFRLRLASRRYSGLPQFSGWQTLSRGPMSRFARITRGWRDAVVPWYSLLAEDTVNCARKGTVPSTAEREKTEPLDSFHSAVLKYMERQITNLFGRSSGKDTGRVFFTERPFDTEKEYASLFHGRLFIPETGRYCFRTSSNASRILKIDGKTLIRRFCFDHPSLRSAETVEIELKKGTHLFQFYYAKGLIREWAAVSWKRKADQEFRLLAWTDFTPAPPPEFQKLESKKGESLPLLMRDDSLELVTGKDDRVPLERLYFLSDPGRSWHWETDKQRWDHLFRLFARNGADPVFRTEGKTPVSLSVRKTPPAFPRIPVYPDAELKLYAPHFLFDDEYGTLTLEILSKMEFPSRLLLRQESDKGGNNDVCFDLPGVPPEREDRFSGSVSRKQSFRIDGAKDPCRYMDFTLALPGLVLDKRSFRIVCASGFPGEVTVSSDGLRDRDGRRLLTILHRNSLHEVRSWEFPGSIRMAVQPVRKVLIISDDFGTFRQELRKQFALSGMPEPVFVSWAKQKLPSGSPVMNTIPHLVELIRKTDADTAVIVPPSAPRRGDLGEREEINLIAFLVELLEKKRIRTVLSSPFPAPEEYRSADLGFTERLRILRREKGIVFSETAHLLLSSPDWSEAVFSGKGTCSLYPEGAAEQCACLLKEAVIKR